MTLIDLLMMTAVGLLVWGSYIIYRSAQANKQLDKLDKKLREVQIDDPIELNKKVRELFKEDFERLAFEVEQAKERRKRGYE